MKIRLYNDIVFKWIFGRQKYTGPVMNFLNSVISYENEEPKFSKIQILNPYDESEPFKREKQGILDIRAKDVKTGEWIDLEVQVQYRSYYPQRSKFYLAGMYRDQLAKSKKDNYDELSPCYGIHILVDSFFKDEKRWFNHYKMLNTQTYEPLIDHWNLYYIELEKFLKHYEKKELAGNELEQWSYFLGTSQDISKQLDQYFKNNKSIEEVFDMLQTFTKDDTMREKYRLHEEWLREQRTIQAQRAKLEANQKKLEKELERERKKRSEEKEAALQDKKDLQKRSILSLKKLGSSNEQIAELLNIPLEEIIQIE